MPHGSARGRHQLGLGSATALVVGHTIGVGIFLTPAEIIGGLAAPALTFALWLLCGGLVLAGAFTFGELASRLPQAGGPYIYLREGWGERVAFLYGWQSLLVMDPGLTAALAAGFSQYVIALWPLADPYARWIAVAFIWILASCNMAGLKLSARVFDAITIFKLLALAAIVGAAFLIGRGSWANFFPLLGERGSVPAGDAVALALVSVFFSFAGFWEASRIASDVRDAGRTLPKALALGVGSLTLIYVVTTAAFIYLVPARNVGSAAEFARRAGEAMLGSAGSAVLAAVVIVSVTASAMALLLMAPQVYVAMSVDGLFPAALAASHPGTRAPVRAIALLAALASVFVFLGSFQQIVAFFMCTALGFIALAAVSLIRIRRGAPDAGEFHAPGYPVSTILFVFLVSGVVGLVAINRPAEAFAGFAIVLLGLPVYARLDTRIGSRASRRP
jgi:APA family basic amino acid/polyamine antiporter